MRTQSEIKKTSKSIFKNECFNSFLGVGLFLLLMVCWAYDIFIAPNEVNQGDVYRIIYLHVPFAFVSLIVASVGLLVFSVFGLTKGREKDLFSAKAWSEVGFVFTSATLITGSIWGKPTWGIWWTWDARLTTTLLLAILLAAYQLIYASTQPGAQRTKVCSILGIIIFFDIPIIYQSVYWWRTLHQPPTILRTGKAHISGEIMTILIINLIVMLLFSIWLWRTRMSNLRLRAEIDEVCQRKLQW